MTHTPGTPASRDIDVIDAQLDKIEEAIPGLTPDDLQRYADVAARMLTTLGRVVEAEIMIRAIELRSVEDKARAYLLESPQNVPITSGNFSRYIDSAMPPLPDELHYEASMHPVSMHGPAFEPMFGSVHTRPDGQQYGVFDSSAYDLAKLLDERPQGIVDIWQELAHQKADWAVRYLQGMMPELFPTFVPLPEPFLMPGDAQGYDAERLDGPRLDLVDKAERYGAGENS